MPFGDLDLDHSVMKAHGGSVPIYVGGELIGTITMSGEPDVVDHETVIEAVRRYQATLAYQPTDFRGQTFEYTVLQELGSLTQARRDRLEETHHVAHNDELVVDETSGDAVPLQDHDVADAAAHFAATRDAATNARMHRAGRIG